MQEAQQSWFCLLTSPAMAGGQLFISGFSFSHRWSGSPCRATVRPSFLSFFFFLIFIWLHWVLVVACRIFDLCCVLQEQGSNPGPLYWDCGVLATGQPSKSPSLSTLHTSSTDCSGWNSGPVYPGTSTFPCRQWTTLAEPVSLSILEKMPSDDFKCSEKPNSPGEFQGKP